MSAAASEGTSGPVSVPYYSDDDDDHTDHSLGFETSQQRATRQHEAPYERQVKLAEELFGVKVGRPGKSRWYRPIVQLLVRPLGFLYGLRHPIYVEGLEHFPKDGPVVTLGNHWKFLDPFLTVCKVHFRPFTAINKLENFKKWYAFVIRGMGQIPLVRTGGTKAQRLCTLDLAGLVLDQGGIISVYPEAHRSPGIITKWHPMMVAELHKRCPHVPFISISIRYEQKGLRRPVYIKFGQAKIHSLAPGKEAAREITAYHRAEVVRMSGLPDRPDIDSSKALRKVG